VLHCVLTCDCRCQLVYDAEVMPKRNFYHSGHNLPIRIETTDRASHQLVSRVLRILLLDVLGYSKVELVGGEASVNATRALNRFTRYVNCIEMWQQPTVFLQSASCFQFTQRPYVSFKWTNFSLSILYSKVCQCMYFDSQARFVSIVVIGTSEPVSSLNRHLNSFWDFVFK